jgi:hypothetical protein
MKSSLRLAVSLAAVALLAPLQALAQMTPTPSYQGIWYASPAESESGWGLNITHQGDILFGTWFTYDADGNAMWLVFSRAELLPDMGMDDGMGMYGMGMSGMGMYGMGNGYPNMMMMPSAHTYVGDLYRATGPSYDAATFDSNAVRQTAVGMVTLRFADAANGRFWYTVDGVSGSKEITRYVYSVPPTCGWEGQVSAGATPNYQDLWWRSPSGSESGWGVNVAHQGDILFATWFTYDAAGHGIWFVMSRGEKVAPNRYSGKLYRASGPSFSASPWNESQVRSTEVGSATFAFSDAANGTFTTTVGGVTQAKPITRFVFAAPATICR